MANENMNQYNLSKLYQEMYYHELDVKEKIVNRLQLTFAFHATLLTATIYMLRMIDLKSPLIALILFFSGLIILLFYLIKSIKEAITAFWGNTYKALATSNDIEAYRRQCIQYAEDLTQYNNDNNCKNGENYLPEQSIDDFLYKEFSKCASHNSKVNEIRSGKNHLAIKYLLFSTIPFLIIALLFTIFDMDTASPRKQFLIEYQGLTSSIEKISTIMGNDLVPILLRIEEDRKRDILTSQLKDTKMPEENTQKGGAETKPSKPSNPPVPPEPPRTRSILEDTGPTPSSSTGSEIIHD
jgi:hypothetical protein